MEHQQAVKKAIRAAGGRLMFCDMTFEDTAEGDLNFTIQGGFAEYEKAVIKKRTVAGREKKARDGIQTARLHSPFGYHIVGNSDVIRGDYPASLLGHYIVVEERASFVREMFARAAAGASQSELARWLNSAGIPPAGGGQFWGHTSIAYILKNPAYKGVAAFGKNDYRADESRRQQINPQTGLPLKTARSSSPADPETWITWPITPIVASEVWDAVQERRQASKGGRPSLRTRMLAGRVFCRECGAGIVSMSSGNVRGNGSTHYGCGRAERRRRELGVRSCWETSCAIAFAEAGTIAAIADALQRPETIARIWEEVRRAYAEEMKLEEFQAEDLKEEVAGSIGQSPEAEMGRIAEALRELGRKQEATVKAQIAGIMAGADASAYSPVFAGIAEQRLRLTARHKRLQDALVATPGPSMPESIMPGQNLSPGDYPRLVADVQRVLESPEVPDADKRQAVRMLVEKVCPTRTNVQVVFRPGIFDETGTLTEEAHPVGSDPLADGLALDKPILPKSPEAPDPA